MRSHLHNSPIVPKVKTLMYLLGAIIINPFVSAISAIIIGTILVIFNIPEIIIDTVPVAIGSILGILVIALLCKKKVKLTEHISISGLNFKLMISITLFFFSFIFVYENIFIWFVSFLNLSPNKIAKIIGQGTMLPLYSTIELILKFLLTAIIVPIVEELFFRVFTIEMLKKEFKTITIVIISSAIFSIVHFYSLEGTIQIFIAAVIMGIIYLKTNNVLYCIIAHAVNNAGCIILQQLIIKDIKLFNQDIGIVISENLEVFSLPIFIIALILMIISLVLLIPILHKDKHKII